MSSAPIESDPLADRLHDPSLEWLEADGLGGFASGTASGIRTRRYHGLLCAARTPPTERVMLVSAVEAWIDLGTGPRALSSHRYLPGVTHPDGTARLASFRCEPFPTWTYELADGVRVVHELFVPRERPEVVLAWRLEGARGPARLSVRPLLAARDLHALAREDASFSLASAALRDGVRWQLTPALPAVRARSNGVFRPEPCWYRDFLYEEERARGYEHVDDLASPGVFEFELAGGPASLALTADSAESVHSAETAHELRERELARRSALEPLERAADAYLVRRGTGLSLVAGYPWFTDWGRDTFIALRGLLLARGKVREAAAVLALWGRHVSEGMLPNRFPDHGDEPEYNSVDASLWYVVAVEEALASGSLGRSERAALERAALAILAGYAGGTRYGIRADDDALLACGEPGTQLTWMDARVDGVALTPRVGKPVEVQALWIHALAFGARREERWRRLHGMALAAFEARFWNESTGHLNDVVDCDHVRGAVDSSLRPNQVLAVGGLARTLVSPAKAQRIVDVLEQELWTPLGLRTLARGDARYAGRYAGGPAERDRVYHQGPAWPWLLGPFVEAWVRVQGSSARAKELARERFLRPLAAHLSQAGLGHVSERADGDAPPLARGCPFQAWSLGELLRLERRVLAMERAPARLAGTGSGMERPC